MNKRSFWISLSLINLCIVALLGFGLRSKILFTIPEINYRDLLSAHSHFAFAGWAGLALMVLMIYDLLPFDLSQKRFYQWILGGIEVSSLGMGILFPVYGYNILTIFFSTLYIVVTLIFVPVFIKDVKRSQLNSTVKLLGISSVLSIVISFLGTLGLIYILSSHSNDSLLYRDSIYVFLHFQYNGFFTLAIFALFLNYLSGKGFITGNNAKWFAIFLCISILPALFLSLLWHGTSWMYVLAALGALFILISLGFFIRLLVSLRKKTLYTSGFASVLLKFSIVSFCLKMLLNVGTIIPDLGNAVYGDRPVIIGFLHLIFLAFLTFYILSVLTENKYFTRNERLIRFPLVIFSTGIFANELILMIQGLSILFKTNNEMYKWLLWFAAIILFTGALLITFTRLSVIKANKKAMVSHGS